MKTSCASGTPSPWGRPAEAPSDAPIAFLDSLAGVLALTKDKPLSKSEKMADSFRRIKEHGKSVAAVKLADRITNLQPPPTHWDTEKKMAYLAEAD